MIPRIDVAFIPSVEEAIFDVGPPLVVTLIAPDGNWMHLSQRKGDG